MATNTANTSYQRVPYEYDASPGTDSDVPNTTATATATATANASSSRPRPRPRPRNPLHNFLAMSFLFSANHGCVVSCLALASARLGTIGAWQSGLLMFSYAASALLGATYAVKTLGARDSLTAGMLLYCAYVACFWVAGHIPAAASSSNLLRAAVAYSGALVGGIGAGFLWTAQGTYFGLASQDHASRCNGAVEDSTARLAGYFASLYLLEELLLRLLSSTLLAWEVASWGTIFGIYTLVALVSTAAMPCCVYDYPSTTERDDAVVPSQTDEDDNEDEDNDNDNDNNNNDFKNSVFYKVTVALYVLRDDPKMKYMIGLNAVFGFVSAFLNSYVNGQVVPVALDDPESKYIGVLTSVVSAVAAAASLLFGKLTSSNKSTNSSTTSDDANANANANSDTNNAGIGTKEAILVFGALCFGGVVLPFCVQPDAGAYGWTSLVVVYALHGLGRATFEGTLRSTFADYFSYEKEGAFANIILQNGIASGVGYILTFALTCEVPSRYCVRYSNGSLHDVLTFELVALVSVVVAVGGFLRASQLHRTEREDGWQRRRLLLLRSEEFEMGQDAGLLPRAD